MNNLFYKSLRFDMSYINLSVPYMQCCGGWKEKNNRVHFNVAQLLKNGGQIFSVRSLA